MDFAVYASTERSGPIVYLFTWFISTLCYTDGIKTAARGGLGYKSTLSNKIFLTQIFGETSTAIKTRSVSVIDTKIHQPEVASKNLEKSN
jgi:hypothetical protein